MKIRYALSALALSVVATFPAMAENDSSLQKIITAAKHEAPITVYASTGKIVKQAKAFSKKYGLKAVGVKAKAPQILEIVSREAQAHNIKTDVAFLSDAPAGIEQLLSKGYVESWLPNDMTGKIPKQYQDPLTVVMAPNVWAYNTAQYDTCPITNIWQLTEPKWHGKIAMQDPLGKPSYTDWFNQMATHYDQAIAQAYQQEFGHPLKTDESSATAAFVKALAENVPLLTHSDSDAAQAIGAPDVKDSFVGLISTAKFRKNKDGMKLGLCHGLKPFIGWNYPSLGLIAKGTHSPNTAKLFIHYMLTEEGIKPQAVDGKMSTNNTFSLPSNEASGIEKYRSEIMSYHTSTADSDWQSRQDWQDLWSLSYQQ
ncbi:ABC transporter substrate-binding protein [Vibrio sp. CAIM 722]|uniref:ABC transporter substrate-binding protein n=1 Tax=Vibrio eleionomae TaxID=2653505 RepID=A0A7X4RT24_9VIBR|nr:ABC transporter substrate-binding protein [Vibrio eleionomae]MZI91629.1 ABC transporter substrate-binding protein [Vibrio eleionomae]